MRIETEWEGFAAREPGYWGIELYDGMGWIEDKGYRMVAEQSEKGAFVFPMNEAVPFPVEEEEQPEESAEEEQPGEEENNPTGTQGLSG